MNMWEECTTFSDFLELLLSLCMLCSMLSPCLRLSFVNDLHSTEILFETKRREKELRKKDVFTFHL
jgi:hypothetical protein